MSEQVSQEDILRELLNRFWWMGVKFGSGDDCDSQTAMEIRDSAIDVTVASMQVTAHPAPSGWQERIAAMDPWLHQSVGMRCYFCGIRYKYDKPHDQQEHPPQCLWQNAVDALPLSSVADAELIAAGQAWPGPGPDCATCHGFGVLKAETPRRVCPDCSGTGTNDALPPAPEVKDASS